VLDEGARQGHTHAGISVTLGNDTAQRVYQSVGFEVVQVCGPELFGGEFPGMVKLRAPLK
jgi:hypothetical protein